MNANLSCVSFCGVHCDGISLYERSVNTLGESSVSRSSPMRAVRCDVLALFFPPFLTFLFDNQPTTHTSPLVPKLQYQGCLPTLPVS